MTRAPGARRKRLVLAAIVVAATGLLFEGALRFLLFVDADWSAELARRYRHELFYADAYHEDDAWVLRARFHPERAGQAHPQFDATLGWTSEAIEPGTLRHVEEPGPEGERLVLLYGDSFARCLTGREDAWEGLLERSALGPSHQLLNYGVGGYGLDQIELLLDATIERHAARNPLVIVGILVDDDLDRPALALRNFPKPRYELVEGELVLHPPLARTPAEFAAAHPPTIRSYAWRHLLHFYLPTRARWALTGEKRQRDEKRALCRALLERIERRLTALALEHFVVLFHAEKSMAVDGPYSWQEPFLHATLRELGIPFVSSKRALLEDMASTGLAPEAYLPLEHHYDARGNKVVFRAFERGLAGEFEPANGYLPGAPARAR
ncbi:MAG: hypothetical protein ABL998_20025 [Planctomycetota bacterium]